MTYFPGTASTNFCTPGAILNQQVTDPFVNHGLNARARHSRIAQRRMPRRAIR
jgi:hypothetical protein